MLTLRRVLSLFVLSVVLVGLQATTASASPIILDDFTGSPGLWNNPTAAGTLQSQPGDARTLILGAPGLTTGGDFVGVGLGIFSHQSADNSTFSTTLSYSFASTAMTTANGLHIDFLSIDGGINHPGFLSALLELSTATGTLSKVVHFPSSNVDTPSVVDFTGLAGLGNLNSVNGISITFNDINDEGVDFRLTADGGPLLINNFDVPEPMTLATLGLIGLCGATIRRRLKKTIA